jgi:hypothetical protein
MNDFLLFSTLTAFEQNIIKSYRSPKDERSLVKQVPVKELEFVKGIVKKAFPDKKLRVRFRGPRIDGMRLTTLKRNARAASVYFN